MVCTPVCVQCSFIGVYRCLHLMSYMLGETYIEEYNDRVMAVVRCEAQVEDCNSHYSDSQKIDGRKL
ncbi:hypothetical protein ACET3Z_008574 [Daucus carota]